MSYRVVLVAIAHDNAVPASHLVAAERSGPPWLAACGRLVVGRMLAPVEVETTVQKPCRFCYLAMSPEARRAFERARPE